MQRVGSTASGASISTSSSLWGNAVPFVLCVSLTVIIDVRAALQAGQLLTLALSRRVLFLPFILRGLFE